MPRPVKPPPPRPPSMREQAYRRIRHAILHATYAPGALLSENQLAEDFGISRTPIREALRDLATGGLVQILPQRGIVVADLSLQDILEVYQLREQLECFAARAAALRMTAADEAAFRAEHLQAVEHLAARRLQAAYDASIQMHSRIVAMAQNARLQRFMQLLADQVHRFGLFTLRHGRAAAALEEHGGIIAALCAHDGDAAAALMRAHLAADRDMVLRLTLPAGTDLPFREHADALPA